MINKVTLIGRLTKDPELKFTPNGVAVTSFSLAVNRSFKNAAGEIEADFINCIVWRKPAENMANFTKKGALVGVSGRWQTRYYEADGKKVYVNECICDEVQFLERAEHKGNNNDKQNNHSNEDYTQPDISDDDLPF